MARVHEPAMNELYQKIFAEIGMPLASGIEAIRCTKTEAQSRYDWQEGIDVLLYFANGTKATLQEKCLTFHASTVTFEEHKTSGAQGAWYYCTAQYYFIGYDRIEANDFQDWILIDLPALHRADANLPWKFNKNTREGRRATFRFLYFGDVPSNCIVARLKADKPAVIARPRQAKQMVMPNIFNITR